MAPRTLTGAKVALYEKVLAQLQEDGFDDEAASLQQKLKLHPRDQKAALSLAETTLWPNLDLEPFPALGAEQTLEHYSDALPELEAREASRPWARLQCRARLQHRGAVVSCGFAQDGKLCATGSQDGMVKVFEARRLRRQTEGAAEQSLLATYTDHAAAVTALAFHPRQPTLVTGSADASLKIFDVVATAGKGSLGGTSDAYGILGLDVHPCGDFVLCGTQHPVVRLHDLATLQCFASMHDEDEHAQAVNDVKYAPDGRAFASASADGCCSIWDAIAHRRVGKLLGHKQPATKARWSRSAQYLLTSGLDGRARLWCLRTGKEVLSYGSGPRTESCVATFAANERYVLLACGGAVPDIQIYETRSGSEVGRVGVFEPGAVRCMETAADQAILAGSEQGTAALLDA